MSMPKRDDSDKKIPDGSIQGNDRIPVDPEHAKLFLHQNGMRIPPDDELTPAVCVAVMQAAIRVARESEQAAIRVARESEQAAIRVARESEKVQDLALEIEKRQAIIDDLAFQLEQQKEHLATDPVTGLNNRWGFNQEVQRLVSRRTDDKKEKESTRKVDLAFPNARIVMFDMNKFKELNTEFGHSGGDEGLKAVASVLRQELRPGDFIARWGGDEFAAILYNVKKQDAERIATRVEKTVAELEIPLPTVKNGSPSGPVRKLPLSVSWGQAKIDPDTTLENITEKASARLLQKKAERDKLFEKSDNHASDQLKRRTFRGSNEVG